MNTEAIKRAVAELGGNSKLAQAIHVAPALVSQWVNGVRPVAARHCIPIEQATSGAVTRYDLLPDVFGDAPETKAA